MLEIIIALVIYGGVMFLLGVAEEVEQQMRNPQK